MWQLQELKETCKEHSSQMLSDLQFLTFCIMIMMIIILSLLYIFYRDMYMILLPQVKIFGSVTSLITWVIDYSSR